MSVPVLCPVLFCFINKKKMDFFY